MSKAQTTRTLNPLPFEHLENKRFEDLVRQLAYGFRKWRQLEATGRSGSDEGFDARGYEITAHIANDDEIDPEESTENFDQDRLWLIQCKRERVIGPSKIKAHMDAIPEESTSNLHGIVFAACCDFSKTTRDTLRETCLERGIKEVHIWGKGEIEDLLFRPENDGLLFAYFNISLLIKRTSYRTRINNKVSIKRKMKRVFDDRNMIHATALLIDPSDENYPVYHDESEPNWIPLPYMGMTHAGLKFEFWRYNAYYDQHTREWDASNVVNKISLNSPMDDPWNLHHHEYEEKSHQEWMSFPPENKAWFYLYCTVPFHEIIAIDEIGDDQTPCPHIYVQFRDGKLPFNRMNQAEIFMPSPYSITSYPVPSKRIKRFSDDLRKEFGVRE
jgi:hypothetical protein